MVRSTEYSELMVQDPDNGENHISTFVAKKPVADGVAGLILLVFFKIRTLLTPFYSTVCGFFRNVRMRGSSYL